MRVLALYVVTLALAAAAWKDWFRAACGLLVLTAVARHPDFPTQILGVSGLQPWNVVFAVTLVAWLVGRRSEGLVWDMPLHMSLLLALYLGVILVGAGRAILSPAPIDWGTSTMVTELLVNPLKYALLGLLLFDGARSRERLNTGLIAVVLLYLILALLVIRWVPPDRALVGGAEFQALTMKRIRDEIGYYRTDLGVMLAGASWLAVSVAGAVGGKVARGALVAAGGAILLALALTAGRGGYLAWICVGLVLCALRWRRYLLVAPAAAVLIVLLLPGVAERGVEGLAGDETRGNEADLDALSAGRFGFWPFIWQKVQEAPWVGHGRLGLARSGLGSRMEGEGLGDVPHPHNAYLEWLLDNGWLGMALVAPFYLVLLHHSLALFLDSRHPAFVAVGGAAFALVFAQLIGGVSGRHWYPEEETVGMWCAVGLMLRVWVERSRG
jgi:O-antigen ligase